MNISDSDKPKVIVLACLVVIVIAFGIYRFINATKPASVQPVDSNASAQDGKSALNDIASSPESVYVSYGGTVRDPFAPQINLNPKAPDKAKPSVKVTNKLPGGSNIVLPPFGISNPGSNTVTVKPEEVKLPNFQLMGVIIGDNPMAVIKGENNSKYMMFEGQSIDNKYLIKSISKSGVWIKYKGQMFVLRLGGENADQKQAQ